MLFQKFSTHTHCGCHDVWIDKHFPAIWIYDFVSYDKDKSNHFLINLTQFLSWLKTKLASKAFDFNSLNNHQFIALHILNKLFQNQPKT